MKQLMEKPEEYVDLFHSLMDKQMKIKSDVVECYLKAENERKRSQEFDGDCDISKWYYFPLDVSPVEA